MPASRAAGIPGARRPFGTHPLLFLAVGLSAGAIVALTGGEDLGRRLVLLTVLGLGVPAALLMLVRPHYAMALYLGVLPLLLPWPIAAGMNAGEVFTLAMVAWGLLSLWQAGDRVERALRSLGPIVWPLALLAVVSAVSLTVNGITDYQDIAAAVLKVLVFALAAILVHVHADTPKKASLLLKAALFGGCAVAFYAIVEYTAAWPNGGEAGSLRAAGTFEHWNVLGGFMALISMPTLALAASSRHTLARLGFATAFLLELTALLLSQTLGSVLALLIGGALVVVFLVRLPWTQVAGGALLILMALVIALVVSDDLRDKVLNIDERIADRLRTYAVGIIMFRDRFWFGFGSEQAIVEELWFGEADYGITGFGLSSSVAHNSFILVGVEKGIIGAILFALVVVGSIRLLAQQRNMLRHRRSALLYAGMATGIAAFLVQNMTNTLVLHARAGIVFFALVALLERLGAHASRTSADA